jgi:hypothetical protein
MKMNLSHPKQLPAARLHSFMLYALALLVGAVPVVAQEQTQVPLDEVNKIGSYVFKPIEIKPSPFEQYEGRFLFINKESSSVRISGFDEPIGRKFKPRFTQFQTLKDGMWKEIQVFYCGTGAQDFAMKPEMEYEFVMYLDSFKEQDAPLTGKVGVDGYWSEPFVLDWKSDRSAGKFELAKKERLEKVRTHFAKAGFKKELLEKEDFCSRLLQSMMKETTAKGIADSFHPFEGKLNVVPAIQLNGSIRIDFGSDIVLDHETEYTGWFVLDPNRFSPAWFRKVVNLHVDTGDWGEGVKMELDDGSSFDSPFYLSIIYEPFGNAKRPTQKEAEKLFLRMLGVMEGWLE